ncbi:MAG: EAL domain-containing protein [Sterolibacteriaceae bacterium]|uniref:EAL domain-containing protein n=1 Tax=Candidatus Methylophosphatis roskildensis TaxID=2899263 RepID=A0A9D7DYZ7_9PROT|nr:EAL domain-containing protein [Candidatus Methylophosphatis roskildensis]MBK7236885.1 EAL domain-containing protein [Sterolibacteriaceae bacterium]
MPAYSGSTGDPKVVALFPEKRESVTQPLDRQAECRSARLLVVGDDELNVEIVKSCLEDLGYKDVIAGARSSSAMVQLAEMDPSLVVFDDSGDGSNALEMLSALSARPHSRSVALIILASRTDLDSRLKALDLGATDFLAKPVDSTELDLRLRRALLAKADTDRLAFSDRITGLSNRDRYFEQLDWALKHAKRVGGSGAVLHIGLDRFGRINDALGSTAGDRVLREVGRRLADCIRETDFVLLPSEPGPTHLVSRLSGDEFSVLLIGLSRPDSAELVAKRVQAAIAEPIRIAERDLAMTCSVGMSVFPNDGSTRDLIFKAAGAALRDAKRNGKGTRRFYSSELNGRALHRLSLEAELRRGLENDELRLFFQPKVDLASGRVCGAEALVRWVHPTRGMVSPAEFIPIAEDSGLIMPLGDWVIGAACEQIRTWQEAGIPVPRIAVNVSIHQFRSQCVNQSVRKALQRSGIDASLLGLEFTESALMENAADNLQLLVELKEIGTQLALDDFGTGYSSLSYLKRFPLDELKIDRSFLSEVETDPNSASIVAAIIALAQRLGLKVVAEGVETEQQLEFLRQHRCDEYQGFLFSQPVPAHELPRLLIG